MVPVPFVVAGSSQSARAVPLVPLVLMPFVLAWSSQNARVVPHLPSMGPHKVPMLPGIVNSTTGNSSTGAICLDAICMQSYLSNTESSQSAQTAWNFEWYQNL